MASSKLAHAVAKVAGIPNGLRTGTVVSVSAAGVSVDVGGGVFAAGVVTSYAPLVGDVVSVFRQDSSWLVLGKTQASMGWTLLTPQNSWTNRGSPYPLAQCRLTGVGVQMIGELNSGTIANGTTIVTSPFLPATETVVLAAIGTTRVRLQLDVDGTMAIFDASVGGVLQYNFFYPMDAVTG